MAILFAPFVVHDWRLSTFAPIGFEHDFLSVSAFLWSRYNSVVHTSVYRVPSHDVRRFHAPTASILPCSHWHAACQVAEGFLADGVDGCDALIVTLLSVAPDIPNANDLILRAAVATTYLAEDPKLRYGVEVRSILSSQDWG